MEKSSECGHELVSATTASTFRSRVHSTNCLLDTVRQRLLSAVPCPRAFGNRHSTTPRPVKRGVNFRGSPFAAVIPGNSAAEVVITTGISNFLSLYNAALIGRIILTWFPSAPAAIVTPLSTVCDPYLNLFRGIIPPLGGTLDLSPILAFVALDLFTNTASALPAELGPDGRPMLPQKRRPGFWKPSRAAAEWRRSMAAQRALKREQSRQELA